MIYIICIVLPPVALLLQGRFFAACFNILLLSAGIVAYPIAALHSLIYVADKRSKKKLKELEDRAYERKPRTYLTNRVNVYHYHDGEQREKEVAERTI